MGGQIGSTFGGSGLGGLVVFIVLLLIVIKIGQVIFKKIANWLSKK